MTRKMDVARKGAVMLKAGLWILGLYAAYGCLLFFLQRNVIFPRFLTALSTETEPLPAGIERVWINASFGKVESYLMLPEKTAGTRKTPVVIFAHGNAERIDFWPRELQPFTQLGVGLFLIEYPGYGRSEGAPSQRSITEVFEKGFEFLIGRTDVDPSRIILFGRSLGGGAVCALAEKRPVRALILMSTFVSVRSFAARYLLPSFLIRDPFDNLAVIRKFKGPVLIVHGSHDEVIPYRHGKILYENASLKEMITYNAGHNDCPPDWSVFWKDVERFLRRFDLIPT